MTESKDSVLKTIITSSALIFATLIGAAVVYTSLTKTSRSAAIVTFDESASTFSSMSFTFKKVGYNPLPYFNKNADILVNYKFLEKYGAIIEPSSNVELHMYDSMSSTTYHYRYKICTSDGQCKIGSKHFVDENDYGSTTVSFKCSPHDTFTYQISELDVSSKQVLRSVSGEAICMYVRREFHSLSVEDRDAFLDASHVLWEMDDATGKARYGENFLSNSMLLRFHQFNAGQQDSDHIHDGLGFLTQHLKFTNMFEASIQSVNPAVHLPYWDFTLDQATGATRPRDSSLFTADVYGSITLPHNIDKGFVYAHDKVSTAAIPDGRWAKLKAEMNTVFPELEFGYGYMRAPWSMNPSPYISRFVKDGKSELPGCKAHYDLLEKYDSSLVTFMFEASYAPHATVHGLLGSMYGCDTFNSLVDSGYILSSDAADKMCSGWPFTMKAFYRKGLVTPSKGCVLNEASLEDSFCPFQCTDANKDLVSAYVMRFYADYIDVTKPDAAEIWSSFVCGGGAAKIYPGDHIESASPADPSFWVIHPTLERLLQVKLMSGGFADESWPTDSTKSFVCAGAQCYDATAEPGDYSRCCYGHYADSQLLDAISGDRNKFYGPTNAEVLQATDPRRDDYSMSYVYDHFEWSHCEGSYSFPTLIASMQATAYSRLLSKE